MLSALVNCVTNGFSCIPQPKPSWKAADQSPWGLQPVKPPACTARLCAMLNFTALSLAFFPPINSECWRKSGRRHRETQFNDSFTAHVQKNKYQFRMNSHTFACKSYTYTVIAAEAVGSVYQDSSRKKMLKSSKHISFASESESSQSKDAHLLLQRKTSSPTAAKPTREPRLHVTCWAWMIHTGARDFMRCKWEAGYEPSMV